MIFGIGFLYLVKRDRHTDSFKISLWTIILLFTTIVLISIAAGQGGYVPQKVDNHCRNAVLYDLTQFSWPVFYGKGLFENGTDISALIYYFNYWLVPAGCAKLFLPFGETVATEAAHALLLIWTSLNLFIVILLIGYYFKSLAAKTMMMCLLILFTVSGLDIIGYLVVNAIDGNKSMYVWTSYCFCTYAGNFASLAWVFNQFVPALLCTVLFLNETEPSKFFILVAGCLICAPFPAVGLALLIFFCLLGMFWLAYQKKSIKLFLKQLFTWESI